MRSIVSGGGADEDDAGAIAGACELGILRQEAVSRMQRLGAGLERRGDDGVDVEIRLARGRRPDAPASSASRT
jgi:hypothetical protein